MSDADENPSRPPREKTLRTAAGAAVNALGNDTFHKGVNWTTLAGTITLAILGYLADAKNGQKQERIATGAASEIAVLQSDAEDAKADLKAQAEQIVQLRLAVAKLQAANEVLAAVGATSPARARARQALEDVQELLEAAAPAPRAAREAPDEAQVEGIKRKLLATE